MEHYIKIRTDKGIVFKKINVINEEEFITKEEEQKQIDNSNDYEMPGESESLLDDEEREMVKAAIKRQQEEVSSTHPVSEEGIRVREKQKEMKDIQKKLLNLHKRV